MSIGWTVRLSRDWSGKLKWLQMYLFSFWCTLAGSMVVDSIVESMSGHSDILFVFAF